MQPMRHGGDQVAREIGGVPAARETDHDQLAAGPDESAHAIQGERCVHVVQRRDRRDEIERAGWERVAEEISDDVLDVGARIAAGEFDARLVDDRRHVRDEPP
jgi:hypothetical protein